MKKAFTVIEVVFVVVMIGILAGVAVWYMPRTQLKQATESIINNLKYTKTLAQLDDRFFGVKDIDYFNTLSIADKDVAAREQIKLYKCGKWQFQFHQASGNNVSTNTYTIFADNAGSATKNFDGKPMDGDVIARDPMTKACISGYNDNNLKECTDNFSNEARFGDTYGVELYNITSNDCTGYRSNTTFSIFFDSEGMPYCKVGQATCNYDSSNANSVKNEASNATLPKRLTSPITIKLKRGGESAHICITKNGLIDAGNPKDKNGNPLKDGSGRIRGIPLTNGICDNI